VAATVLCVVLVGLLYGRFSGVARVSPENTRAFSVDLAPLDLVLRMSEPNGGVVRPPADANQLILNLNFDADKRFRYVAELVTEDVRGRNTLLEQVLVYNSSGYFSLAAPKALFGEGGVYEIYLYAISPDLPVRVEGEPVEQYVLEIEML
jgi:hypothetical protein